MVAVSVSKDGLIFSLSPNSATLGLSHWKCSVEGNWFCYLFSVFPGFSFPYNQADFLGERSVDLFVDSFCCFETDFLETQAGGEKL